MARMHMRNAFPSEAMVKQFLTQHDGYMQIILEVNFSVCTPNAGALRPHSMAFLPVEVWVEGVVEVGAVLRRDHLQLSSSRVSQ